MYFLIVIAIIAGGIWLAIEFQNFRKALLITGAGLLLLAGVCVYAIMRH